MVTRRFFGMYVDGLRFEMGVPQPPTIMVGRGNAGCEWDALFCQRSMKAYHDFCRLMRRKSNRNLKLREVDSAMTGLKVFTEEMRQKDGASAAVGASHVVGVCGLHQTSHVVGSLIKAIAVKPVGSMHAHASLLRMGNFWIRTMLSIEAFFGVDSNFKVSFDPPSSSATSHSKTISAFFPQRVGSSHPGGTGIMAPSVDD